MLWSAVAYTLLDQAFWHRTLDQLCAHPAEFRRIGHTREGKEIEVLRWLEAAGVRAKLGSQNRQIPGLELDWWGIVPISGKKGYIVTLSLIDSKGGCEVGHWPVVFLDHGRTLAAAPVYTGDLESSIRPHSAAFAHGSLFIEGDQAWYGNAPNPAAARLQLQGGKWRAVKVISSDYETDRVEPLHVVRSGIPAIHVWTTTYPDNLGTSHSSACVGMEAKWTFGTTGPRVLLKRRMRTPLNQLDDLVGALERGDRCGARRLCLTEAVYRQAWSIRGHLPNRSVSYPHRISVTEPVIDVGEDWRFEWTYRTRGWLLQTVRRIRPTPDNR